MDYQQPHQTKPIFCETVVLIRFEPTHLAEAAAAWLYHRTSAKGRGICSIGLLGCLVVNYLIYHVHLKYMSINISRLITILQHLPIF